jgi:hypothetical protein
MLSRLGISSLHFSLGYCHDLCVQALLLSDVSIDLYRVGIAFVLGHPWRRLRRIRPIARAREREIR